MNLLNHLSLDKVVEALWCGTAKEFRHDMLQHSVTFFVEVNENEILKYYSVKFERVYKIELTYDEPNEPWNYVELTEIEITKSDKGFLFESELWSDCFMKIEAGNLEVFETSEI